MMKLSTVVSSLIILLAITAAAYAQNEQGIISINPHLGGYIFDSDQDINSDPVYGLDIGYNLTDRWGVEGSFDYVNTNVKAPSRSDGVKAYIYRLGALYHFLLEEGVVPYLGAGAGAIRLELENRDDDTDFILNYGGGIKFLATERLALRGDVRHIISVDDSAHNLMYTVGLTYLLGKKEKAPPPPLDSDGDGVPDDRDKCPDTPPGTAVDADGCPKDSDGDGVTDDKDNCPGTPAGIEVDADGCPKDSDGDGVPDYLDQCPGTPRGVVIDSQGCPLDSDGDGVPDYLDECPGTPKGVEVDERGCPKVKKPKPISLDNIYFEFNKAILTKEAMDTLNKNIQLMKDNPEINVRIEGHSCAHGPEDYNLRLSERRANAVKEYFVNEGGISEDRMTTISYGETRLAMPEVPTPENKNSIEAKTNRRSQFTVIMY
jgi:OOP family OmpA-OmpF porin